MPCRFVILLLSVAISGCISSASIDNAITDYYFPEPPDGARDASKPPAVVNLETLRPKLPFGRPAGLRSSMTRNLHDYQVGDAIEKYRVDVNQNTDGDMPAPARNLEYINGEWVKAAR